LLEGIGSRRAECLDALYRRFAVHVFSLAYRIGRDASIAEEATQDVFIQVWRDGHTYDADRGSIRSWLLTIARARTLDRLRAQQVRRGRHAPADAADAITLPHGPSTPETSAVSSERAALLQNVLAVLPPPDRRLLELAYFEGLTQAEIAGTLGQPLGTIKTQTRRALRLLLDAIGEHAAPPFAWQTWAGAAGVPPHGAPQRLQHLNLLVVDDDADTLKLLTLVLQRAGATVVAAASASQALKRLDARVPDMLVTDLDMPQQDGYGLLAEVRRRADGDRRMPAVAFSAHNADEDRMRSAEAGFDLHLPKPIRPAVLVSHLVELARWIPRLTEESA
jgi:RNA polymerase sigma-70 factor (ECF subfamily)